MSSSDVRVVDVSCNRCGAPLEVRQTTRFVTCDHCGARLEVVRKGGAAFTEVLERVEKLDQRTEALEDELRRSKREAALEKLENEWREECRESGWAAPEKPTGPPEFDRLVVAGRLFFLLAFVLGGTTLFLGSRIDDDGLVPLVAIGLFFVAIFGAFGLSFFRTVPRIRRRYEEARRKHEARLAALLKTLDVGASENEPQPAADAPPQGSDR